MSFTKELRTAFNANRRHLSLSVAVNAGKWLTDSAYDYPTMARYCQYVTFLQKKSSFISSL